MGRKRIYPYTQLRNCEICGEIYQRHVRNKYQAACGWCCSKRCKEIRRMRRREAGITTPGRPKTSIKKNAPSADLPKVQRKSRIPMPTDYEKSLWKF